MLLVGHNLNLVLGCVMNEKKGFIGLTVKQNYYSIIKNNTEICDGQEDVEDLSDNESQKSNNSTDVAVHDSDNDEN
jgi:hypothetical protein